MPHRVMIATALALGLTGAAALVFPGDPPAERVATRAEMIASYPARAAIQVACTLTPAPRLPAEI